MTSTFSSTAAFRLLAHARAEGALLIVPTDRAAALLRHLYDTEQRATGLRAWQPAEVLSWPSWLSSLWNDLVVNGAETRLLLNSAQEHVLWREVIAAAPIDQLDNLDSLADLARYAYALAANWNALPGLRRYASTRDALTFAAWAETFQRNCKKQQALSSSMLAGALAEHVNPGVSVATNIHLAGFHEFIPTQTTLLDALRAHGAHIHENTAFHEADAPTQATHFILAADDEAAEWRDTAQWIRTLFARASAGENSQPVPRVALLLPDPAGERGPLESVLRSVLAPELDDIAADTSSAPWSFSAVLPLAQTALADTALTLLRWLTTPLPLERVSSLLLSPCLVAQSALHAFAEFDAFTLREQTFLRPELGIADIRRIARSSSTSVVQSETVLPLLDRLDSLQRRFNSGPQQRSFANWMQFTRDILRAAGWPGDRPPNVAEAHTLRAWDHLLDLVATLDIRDERVTFSVALDALALAAKNAPSMSADHAAPIQIMSFAEAATTLPLASFDAVVVLHATEQNWPPPERANPLLSWALQQSLAMPGTDAAHTAERAQQLTASILASAPKALFAFAEETADGPQRLSPLLAARNFPRAELNEAPPTSPLIAEEIYEDTAPLPPLPSTHVSGGATVLQLQASCGFRAFAEIRLGSHEPRRHELGFDPMQGGNVVHLAMQHFWEHVHSHAELTALSLDDRTGALDAAIDYALTKQPAAAGDWDKSYLALQRRRLLRLLLAWLEFELQRATFRVTEREDKREVHVGPLTLSVRLDRVDEVNGGLALIDYKTGKASPKDWGLPRPDAPQLPLYSLLEPPENIRAIAFARLRAGDEMQWSGYAAKGVLPKLPRDNPADLAAQIAAWRVELERLAYDFAHGHAGVSPKSYPVTCKHCGQLLLCRLDAATLHPADDGDGEADDDA